MLLTRTNKRHIAGQLFIANRRIAVIQIWTAIKTLALVEVLLVLFGKSELQPHDQCLAPFFLMLPVVVASGTRTPLATSSSLPEISF